MTKEEQEINEFMEKKASEIVHFLLHRITPQRTIVEVSKKEYAALGILNDCVSRMIKGKLLLEGDLERWTDTLNTSQLTISTTESTIVNPGPSRFTADSFIKRMKKYFWDAMTLGSLYTKTAFK
jgi:hypothetical protein